MALHGKNLLGGKPSGEGSVLIHGMNPGTGETLEPAFLQATEGEINTAVRMADEAFRADTGRSPEDRAALLETVAEEIEGLGDELVQRVCAETGLPEGRILGERLRTTGQLRMFADLVREGSWVDARIDRAMPNRMPLPKPDIRRMLVPLGPVAVFGASNFPLAFSVAGGDTASALAAGCPVVCKGHPAHPGTSELVATAISRAVEKTGFHPGTFSLVHGLSPEVSLSLVRHPSIRAVGFTGSLQAGRSLFDAAARRPDPIPVYAEMGSVNPVFILPGALKERGREIAEGLVASVTLGAGQFCTNPGLVFGLEGPELDGFAGSVAEVVQDSPAQTMLHSGIQTSFRKGVEEWDGTSGVSALGTGADPGEGSGASARAAVYVADGTVFAENPHLAEEVFGPVSLLVRAGSVQELVTLAESMEGNLTATIHGTDEELEREGELIRALERKVGRLIFNSFPTGVEVCPSMQHGGPYPATSDPRSTSVGTAAVYRFARPMAWQGFPDRTLPAELQDANPRGIWRLVDGSLTQDPV
jgi:NADP-dependent aldehyde dehydrogenase